MKTYVDTKILYAKLAADSGKSEQHIRNIIHCKDGRRPSPGFAHKLESLTGIKISIWLSGDPSEIISALEQARL